jgi:hypothetical protein
LSFFNSFISFSSARAFKQSIELMISTGDPYQFSMNESISETPRTRNSSRNRKPISTNTEKTTNKKKQTENVSKTNQQRLGTRSSQKSPLIPTNDENDNSFMSNLDGFSQFVNPKKRQRDEKKTKTFKRPKSIYSSFFFLILHF